MDDALGVGLLQSLGNLDRCAQGIVRLCKGHFLPECAAVNILHHDEHLPPVVFNAVDRANMRMVQRGSRFCFLHESRFRFLVQRDVGRKKLQRDRSVEFRILGLVHNAHSAFAEFFKDLVM